MVTESELNGGLVWEKWAGLRCLSVTRKQEQKLMLKKISSEIVHVKSFRIYGHVAFTGKLLTAWFFNMVSPPSIVL